MKMTIMQWVVTALAVVAMFVGQFWITWILMTLLCVYRLGLIIEEAKDNAFARGYSTAMEEVRMSNFEN